MTGQSARADEVAGLLITWLLIPLGYASLHPTTSTWPNMISLRFLSALSLFSLVYAADYRLLANKPLCVNISQFQES